MTHDFSIVFDTDNPLWQRVLEIYEANEKYPKKVVSNRNLHHKFPRSFSKKLNEEVDNDKDNLVSLSLSDHFLVHYYYYKLAKKGYRQSMATAFTLMSRKSIKYMSPDTAEMLAKDYEEAAHLQKSPEFKEKIRKANLEGRCGMLGKSHSEDTRKKMSESAKKAATEEVCKARSEHNGQLHNYTYKVNGKWFTVNTGDYILSKEDREILHFMYVEEPTEWRKRIEEITKILERMEEINK